MGDDNCARTTQSKATRATPSLQSRSQDLEDMVMKRAIPAMAKLMRSELDQEFRTLIPDMVKEVLKQLNQSSCSRSSPQHVDTPASKRLKLIFEGTLPDTLLTFSNIECHEGASLSVELQDGSGSKVEDGPEASLKIKIFVLHGDFEIEDTDDWTRQDFDKNVVRPRKDKGALIKGKCEINMSKGAASVSGITFTDNSKCMRDGTFRLGARAVKGLPPGVEIRDAVSEPFKVKERRVKSNRKHKIPSPEDPTRSLKNVGPTLCLKLAANGIHTVKDFLRLYHTDANKLQNILQVAGNKWSELVKNANLCSLSEEHYQHYDEASGVELILDCVFNIVRVTFNSKVSLPYRDLDDSQKGLVDKIRLAAYEKKEKMTRTCSLNNPTPPQNKHVYQSIIDLHSNAQHLDGTVTDTTALMPCPNPAVDSMLRGHELCRITPDKANQGVEESLPLQSSRDPNAGQEWLSLMPTEPRIPTNKDQDSGFQHKSLNTSPNSSSEGTNASMNYEQFRAVPATDAQIVMHAVTVPEDPVSHFDGESKRRRLGDTY